MPVMTDQPLLIVAALCVVAAFCVVGLLIQREYETQQRISDRYHREYRRELFEQTQQQTQQQQRLAALPVPLPLAVDGGAPLLGVALVRVPSSASIPDETDSPRIGDIAEQPTQIIPAAQAAQIAAGMAERQPVPPRILQAYGGRWLLARLWPLPDDALN